VARAGGRLRELGRQPDTTQRFLLRHADRILFGLDAGPSLDDYRIVYRFLETDDAYFDYSPDPIPPPGHWRIYGLGLPHDVLKQVYHDNAQRILPS